MIEQQEPNVTPAPTLELAESVAKRVEQLKSHWYDQGAMRRAEVRALEKFASGDQLSTTPRNSGETQHHWERKPKFTPNLLQAVLDRLGGLYTVAPLREARKSDVPTWRRILWPQLDDTMRGEDVRVQLTGARLAVVQPWPAIQDAEVQRLDVRYVGQDRAVWTADPSDPTQVGAALIHHSTVRAGSESVAVRYYWDAEVLVQLQGWETKWVARHSYGIPPCAVLSNSETHPLGGGAIGGEDLLPNLRAIAAYIRELVHTARLQRGQPWGKGLIGNKVLGPDSMVEVDPAGDFGFASNAADLNGMIEVLERMLAAFAVSVGLPRDALSLSGPRDRVAEHAALAEQRQRRAPLGRMWERNIHRVGAAVWGATGTELAWEQARATYQEDPPPLSAGERQSQAAFGIQHGLRDEYDTARLLWPWMREADLRAMVDRGLAAQQKRVSQRALIAGHAQDDPTTAQPAAPGDAEPEPAED